VDSHSHPNLANNAKLGWGTRQNHEIDTVVDSQSHPNLAQDARLGWGTRVFV